MRILLAVTLTLSLSACSGDDGDDLTTGASTTTVGSSSSGSTGSTGSAASTGSTTSPTSAGTTTGSTGSSSGSTSTGSGSSSTGGAGLTWNNFAQDFMQTYCWECHGAGDTLRDYTILAEVVAEAANIRCGVSPTALPDCQGMASPGQFPVGNNKPTDAERNDFVAWIEAGLPEG